MLAVSVYRRRADQREIEVARLLGDALAERFAQPAPQSGSGRCARHQLRHVARLRIADQRGQRVGARERRGFGAQFGGQLQRVQRAFAARVGQPLQRGRFDIDGEPVGFETRGEPRRRAHQRGCLWPRTDAHEQTLARLPDTLDRTISAIFPHLRIDAIGGAAQRQLAQRNQIAFAEEVAHRALGLLRQIHLAVAHPVEQFLGGQIDQRDFVGMIEHAVGHRLPYADPGDLADHVVQTFQMLNVDRRVDVDARVEQFIHVLPALQMPRALHVRMREFVDQNQLRLARERGVEIELAELAAAIVDMRERQHVEPVEQRGGFAAAMRFGDADQYVRTFVVTAACGLQHRVGLAHARRRAKENLQPATLTLFFVALQLVEQFVRIGAVHA